MAFDEVSIHFRSVTWVQGRVRNAKFLLYTYNILNIVADHLKSIIFHIFTDFWQQPQLADFQTVNVGSDENAGLMIGQRNAIGISK